MPRENQAVTSDELAKIAARADDLRHDLSVLAERMQKKFTQDVGDEFNVLSRLAGLAEGALELHRMVLASAQMGRMAKRVQEGKP